MSTFYALNMKATKMALCPLPLSLCGRQHIKKKKVVRQNACQYWDRSPREEGSEERISRGRVLWGKLGNSLLLQFGYKEGRGYWLAARSRSRQSKGRNSGTCSSPTGSDLLTSTSFTPPPLPIPTRGSRIVFRWRFLVPVPHIGSKLQWCHHGFFSFLRTIILSLQCFSRNNVRSG